MMRTTILIKRETRDKLKKLKYELDTNYDRLLQGFVKLYRSDESIRDRIRGML